MPEPATGSQTYYLLWCMECHPKELPMPFASHEERLTWLTAHMATGHSRYALDTETR